jgi:predicted ATPase
MTVFDLLVGGSRTAPSRQQTLRATLDWATDCSVTTSAHCSVAWPWLPSCSVDAAEAICVDADVAQSAVLDLLQRLVDKSMVVMFERHGQAGTACSSPSDQYADERLIASGERDAAQRRHARTTGLW